MANSYLIHHKHILWVRFYLFLDNVNKVLFQLLQVSDGFFQEEVSMHPDPNTDKCELSWRLPLPRSEVTCRGAWGRRGGRHSRGRAPAACCTTPSSPPGHHHHHHHYHHHYHHLVSAAPRHPVQDLLEPLLRGLGATEYREPRHLQLVSTEGSTVRCQKIKRENKSSVINKIVNILLSNMFLHMKMPTLFLSCGPCLVSTVV